jgi:zinc protease
MTLTAIDKQRLGDRLEVWRYRLDNGLSLLVAPDHAAPTLAYQTWFRVGSRHETPGKTGLAHLFEHLMFNQTANLAAGEFDRRLEAVGGETNAATWVDWTYYRDSIPAAQLELVTELEADRMAHLTLTERQVESEREVVASERRLRVDDDVDGFLAEQLFATAFEQHPYHWPTIGWMADIMAFTPDDCRDFYRRFYAPGNATIVVVGDAAPDRVAELVEARYGAIPPQPIHAAGSQVTEPAQVAERRRVFAKPVSSEHALYGWRAPAQVQRDWLPLQLATEILLGGPSSRLYRRLVVESQLCSSVSGMLMPVAQPGLFELGVTMMRGKSASLAEAIIDEELARLGKEPVPTRELERVKNRYETAFWSELEGFDGRAEALGHYESVLGDFRGLFDAAARVPTIDAEEIRHAAATYLRRDQRTAVIAEPSGELDDEDDDDDQPEGARA